jgi:hypothetical protein
MLMKMGGNFPIFKKGWEWKLGGGALAPNLEALSFIHPQHCQKLKQKSNIKTLSLSLIISLLRHPRETMQVTHLSAMEMTLGFVSAHSVKCYKFRMSSQGPLLNPQVTDTESLEHATPHRASDLCPKYSIQESHGSLQFLFSSVDTECQQGRKTGSYP